MYALIDNATGRILASGPEAPTASANQTVINVSGDVNLIDPTQWKYDFTLDAQGAPIGLRPATQAEIDAEIALRKDAVADLLVSASGELDPVYLKKAFAAMLKVTHDHLQAIETAAGLPASTVPGFAAFVTLVKTDFRNRL